MPQKSFCSIFSCSQSESSQPNELMYPCKLNKFILFYRSVYLAAPKERAWELENDFDFVPRSINFERTPFGNRIDWLFSRFSKWRATNTKLRDIINITGSAEELEKCKIAFTAEQNQILEKWRKICGIEWNNANEADKPKSQPEQEQKSQCKI